MKPAPADGRYRPHDGTSPRGTTRFVPPTASRPRCRTPEAATRGQLRTRRRNPAPVATQTPRPCRQGREPTSARIIHIGRIANATSRRRSSTVLNHRLTRRGKCRRPMDSSLRTSQNPTGFPISQAADRLPPGRSGGLRPKVGQSVHRPSLPKPNGLFDRLGREGVSGAFRASS